MSPAKAPILSFWPMASAQAAIFSLAAAPTIVAPRIRTAAVGDHLDVAVGRCRAHRAVILAVGPAQDANGAGMRARFVLQQADLGKLRIGKGDPRYGAMVDRNWMPEQSVADDEPGMMIGDMGEFGARRLHRRSHRLS